MTELGELKAAYVAALDAACDAAWDAAWDAASCSTSTVSFCFKMAI